MLLICDGLSHVQSRMGMLDVFAALFVLAAFATLICDRDDVRARLAVVLAEGRIDDSPYGPRLGVRWWRFATGVLLGLGCAVKWSGVYWLAAFARAHARLRRHGAAGRRRAPPVGGDDRARLAPAVWVLALLPVLVYVGSWWGWFRSETGIDRNVVGYDRGANGVGPDGPWAFVPDALRSLWFYSGARPRLPRRADHAVQRAAPVGVQAVDVADGPAADALLLRLGRARSEAAGPATASAPSC